MVTPSSSASENRKKWKYMDVDNIFIFVPKQKKTVLTTPTVYNIDKLSIFQNSKYRLFSNFF